MIGKKRMEPSFHAPPPAKPGKNPFWRPRLSASTPRRAPQICAITAGIVAMGACQKNDIFMPEGINRNSERLLTHQKRALSQVKTPSACMALNPYIPSHSMQSLCEQRLLGGAEETNKASNSKQFERFQ
ncbi:hypothetical protein PEC18_05845 [Paucibacter sp. O1-1]|nr:hypothetical protein [Paucibacter sp. O1-1]MDA3825392.1 hypothetical protein [Paucibacter sp. O1-1]